MKLRKRILIALTLPIALAILAVNREANVAYVPVISVLTLGAELAIFSLRKRENVVVLFALSLTILWSVTAWGDYLVGVDIHSEYGLADTVIRNGWNIANYNSNNTSIVLAFIAPAIARIIPLIWQFKLVYPAVFAFMPCILYLAYERQFGHRIAWLACIYLITMPMFQYETTSMVKSMVAQTLIAVVIYLFTVRATVKKRLILIGAGILAGFSHYAVAAIMTWYLVAIAVLSPLIGLIPAWARRGTAGKWFPATVIVILLANWLWFSNVGQGAMVATLKATADNLAAAGASTVAGEKTELTEKYTDRTVPDKGGGYLNQQEETIRAAIGLDFWEVTAWGKGFRLIQFIIEGSLIIGVCVILFRPRKYHVRTEYLCGMIAGLGLLLACVFVPFVSTTASASRFYQLSLLFTAPAIIVGLQFTTETIGRGLSWVKYRALLWALYD